MPTARVGDDDTISAAGNDHGARRIDVVLVIVQGLNETTKFRQTRDVAKAATPAAHSKAVRDAHWGELATMRDDELAAIDRPSASRAGIAEIDTV